MMKQVKQRKEVVEEAGIRQMNPIFAHSASSAARVNARNEAKRQARVERDKKDEEVRQRLAREEAAKQKKVREAAKRAAERAAKEAKEQAEKEAEEEKLQKEEAEPAVLAPEESDSVPDLSQYAFVPPDRFSAQEVTERMVSDTDKTIEALTEADLLV